MTDDRKQWWQAFLTPQNILTAVLAIFAAGGYWQDSKQQSVRMDQQDLRLERIEQRIATERVTSDLIYMRRDVLTEQLRLIQEEQMRQRELIQLVRKDLR